MADDTRFKPGNAGKKPGTTHKTTKAAKELVIQLVECGLDKAMQKLSEIDDPKDYLDILSKYIGYVIPKKTTTDLTTDGQPIVWHEVKTYESDSKAD